jgi:hypothetical protein
MRVFFGTLRVLISQLSYDAVMYFYDLSAVLWETRRNVFKRIAIFIGVIVILLFDIWISIALYRWGEYPAVLTFAILVGFFQVGAWISRKKIYSWFLNEWGRASQTYQYRKIKTRIVENYNDHKSAVGKALDACSDSDDLNKTINDRTSFDRTSL